MLLRRTISKLDVFGARCLILCVALLLVLEAPRTVAAKELEIVTVGAIKTLYRWSTDRCEDEFLPDSPARAFRRADGKVAVMAAHRENWLLVGDTLTRARPVCKSVLRSSEYQRERLGSLWIQAIYTADGLNVSALLSQDLRKVMIADGCKTMGVPGRCWINNILAAQSSDMGQSFKLFPKHDRTVATLGSNYRDATAGRYGVFTASNIAERDGFFYVFVGVQAGNRQESGNCLFRTRTPSDPGSWRAWSGKGSFDADLRVLDSAATCKPVGKGALRREVRSVTLDKRSGRWIAVFGSREKLAGDPKPIAGFYYSVSDDLLSWSAPRRLMSAPLKPREEQNEFYMQYPSLIDPESLSRNFDTIDGSAPILLFSRSHLKNGKGTLNRDLQFIQLDISR